MKHNLLNITVAALSTLFSLGAVTGQTTILEQDGANNEFVVEDWTTNDPFSIVGTDKVNIQTNDEGILSISNTSAYTNIKVELHFSQPNSISFNMDISGPNGNEAMNSIISDATGTPNKAVVSFNNETGLVLDEMKISNPSMTMGIIYLKITGELDGTNAIATEDFDLFMVKVNPESLLIHTETEGQLSIYNDAGQLTSSHQISKGENTIANASKGISFLVFTNANKEVLSRKKIMR
ncbi:hypothetical protein [Brumimicrobium sp.]|uniref:hypothetical protein n=1 Tax=Brumimicrobium sp. TaxID=2029867 RepID=UPI003A8E4903